MGKKMEELINELATKKAEILEMGGREKIEKEHAKGKMSARERIDYLFDSGTFSELGIFVVLALIYIAIVSVSSATIVGEFIVIGPLAVGLFYISFKKIQVKPFQIGDIAKGILPFKTDMFTG